MIDSYKYVLRYNSYNKKGLASEWLNFIEELESKRYTDFIKKIMGINYFDLRLGSESSRYIFRILAMKEIIENPIKYGFIFDETDLYNTIPIRNISVDTPIVNLSKFAKKLNINYKILKIHNSWLRQNHLNNRSRKKYNIEIPLDGVSPASNVPLPRIKNEK